MERVGRLKIGRVPIFVCILIPPLKVRGGNGELLQTIALSLCCTVALTLTSPPEALGAPFGEGELITELGVISSSLRGHTTYHISYYEGSSGIESELEFPLKTYLIGLDGAISYKENSYEKLRLGFRVMKNIDNGSGRLKDSDWLSDDLDISLYGVAHPGKDIYSESDIKLDALIIDLNMSYSLFSSKHLSFKPSIGYKHQGFRFVVSNVSQTGYGPYSSDFTVYVPGEALHYRIRYEFIYGGLDTEFLIGKDLRFLLKGGAGYVYAKDRDDHILRYKLATASADGAGGFLSICGDYNIFKGLHLKVGGEYLRFHTRGTQHQYFYRPNPDCPTGSCDAYISDRIDSEQWNISLILSYEFE